MNSLGLNEQELLFLAHSVETAPHNDYYTNLKDQPDLLKVIDQLEWLLKSYGKSSRNPESKLTRIHFHCLTYHLIVVSDSQQWSNTVASLMAGSKIASKQASGFEFNNEENETTLDERLSFQIKHQLDQHQNIEFKISRSHTVAFNTSHPVIEFQRGTNLNFFFTPVLVCKKPTKTVGLGDAISSTGLIYSSFNFN